MKNKIFTRILSLTGAIIILAGVAGCKDMFIDPTKDKTTGEAVTLLLIDRNFIKTKFYVQLVDNITGEEITSEQVTVYFIGADSANMVTFGGEKKAVYTTSSAFLEVGYDPAIPVNNENPIQFTLFARSDHYTTAAKYYTYTTEGVKNIIVKLYRKGSSGPILKGFREPFTLRFNNSDWSTGIDFLSSYDSYSGNGYKYYWSYDTFLAGTITCSDANEAEYEDYGVYYSWYVEPLLRYHFPPDPPKRTVAVPVYAYIQTVAKRTGLQLCNSSLTIRVNGPAGGSGSFNYFIYFSDGSFQEGRITCSRFPSDNVIEQIYFPIEDENVSIYVYGDAQYNIQNPVILKSPCGNMAEFSASPKSNLKTYKFVTTMICPNKPVGFALTIGGQFRKKIQPGSGPEGSWSDFAFNSGVCELRLEAGYDHEFRINIDGDYYSFTLPTIPEQIEDVLRNSQSEDYKIKKLTIDEADNLVTINAAVEFSAGICKYLK